MLEKKQKKIIKKEEWFKQISDITIPKEELNKLVMNFFIVEGYKDAAEKFAEESGMIVSQQDLNLMADRLEVRNLIHQGLIDQAIQRLKTLNNNILENNIKLNFNLLLQKLIELIKENKIMESIEFAKNQIVPIVQNNQEYLDELQKVMSLLAFENIQQCPVNDLVSISNRIKISSLVNFEMLKSNSNEKESQLPALLKLMLWQQKRLQEKIQFPYVTSNLPQCEFDNVEEQKNSSSKKQKQHQLQQNESTQSI